MAKGKKKGRKRTRAERAAAALRGRVSSSLEEVAQACDVEGYREARETEFMHGFLFRVANFPPGMMLAASALRPDGGVHNVMVSTDDLRRAARAVMERLGIGMPP